MKTYINTLLIAILVGGFMCSCSGDNDVDIIEPSAKSEGNALSIVFALPTGEAQPKASGNYDPINTIPSESFIYSLDVLIFKSSDGTLDKGDTESSKKRIGNIEKDVVGFDYSRAYDVVSKIEGIQMSAGTRDIYIIANAPVNSFTTVNTVAQLKAAVANLSQQGIWEGGIPVAPGADNVILSGGKLLAHPSDTRVTVNTNGPIGGVAAPNLNTRLTMCAVIKNVVFDKSKKKHSIGFGVNPGADKGVPTSGGTALSAPVKLTRLVARVAVKKIEFALDNSILIGATSVNTTDASKFFYKLNGVSLVNSKSTARFLGDGNKIIDSFAHGSTEAYNAVKAAGWAASTSLQSLHEDIQGRSYDITKNHIPLWFYTFENTESATDAKATRFVVGVVYNYMDGGVAKSAKYYYPVVIKAPGLVTTDSFILPNYQYGLNIKIKKTAGGSPSGTPTPLSLRSDADSIYDDVFVADESCIEVETEVGTDLFPWAGDKYIINN